jgi:hypothetical protein
MSNSTSVTSKLIYIKSNIALYDIGTTTTTADGKEAHTTTTFEHIC